MAAKYPWSADTVAERLQCVHSLFETGDDSIKSVFTQLFSQERDNNEHGKNSGPLDGAIVSVKDLFDVKGYTTKAGTQFLSDNAAATDDAPPIKNLRQAGSTLIGHTNMTELAYSGLGLNPHYGTPENALLPEHIPGGSSSGGAISVAKGFADIAIGTDTGGSVRIPAAFNGIVGFKPTQNTVSRVGCKTLSHTLDSVGPMAKTIEACELAYQVMSASAPNKQCNAKPSFIVPTNFGMTEMDDAVSSGFDAAVTAITSAGFQVVHREIESLEALKQLPIWHFASIECRSEYHEAFLNRAAEFDPRVHSRMVRAAEVDAVTYRQTLNDRARLIEQHRAELNTDILLMPTVPIMPPSFSSVANDEDYYQTNLLVLRNPTVANVLDCCSVSLPLTTRKGTIGVMLNALGGSDYRLLNTAKLVFDEIKAIHN